LAAVVVVATVLVMDVLALTRIKITGRLRQRRRFLGEKPPTTVLLRRQATAWTSLDAHCVIGVRNAVDLHCATRKPHFRLNAFAMQPRWQVEHHGVARA
jgi:hypothetical protein